MTSESEGKFLNHNIHTEDRVFTGFLLRGTANHLKSSYCLKRILTVAGYNARGVTHFCQNLLRI